MSIERQLIQRAQVFMPHNMTDDLLHEEIQKGCRPDVSAQPIALEPPYQPLAAVAGRRRDGILHVVPAKPLAAKDLMRVQIWMSQAESFDWLRAERFLKQLTGTRHRVGFEIVGNQRDIKLMLLFARGDWPVIATAFEGEYSSSKLAPLEASPLDTLPSAVWGDLRLSDFYTPPPYSHLLTRPEELKTSCFDSLLMVLSNLPTTVTGIYQCLFQPVAAASRWHVNVEQLVDREYEGKKVSPNAASARVDQQVPSGQLNEMTDQVTAKAHPDKPFFCAAARLAVLGGGSKGRDMLRALETFVSLFQHQGRQLEKISEAAYRCLGSEGLRDMFLRGISYRPGILINSRELTGLAHAPVMPRERRHMFPIDMLDPLAPQPNSFREGVRIGTYQDAGRLREIRLSTKLRLHHVHLIGRPGMGKSSVMENMILGDVQSEAGVAVIDPHGDLVERLLQLLPQEAISRTIYFNPSDRQNIPIWNPLLPVAGQDLGHMADDIVDAVKSFISGWGDRLAHLLRHAIYALLHRKGSTFSDVATLLRFGSPESERLRQEIVPLLKNTGAVYFWTHDYRGYTRSDLGPPQHKLSKLLVNDSVALMLSQPDSAFSIRDIADQGKIFLANLGQLGLEIRSVLGCLLLALFHIHARGRSAQAPELRKPFHIFCDEAHEFLTDTMAESLVAARKFAVSLHLAHQYMKQFSSDKADALSSAGSTIIFNVNTADAGHLVRDLGGVADVNDIIGLKLGQAIVRAETEVVRIRADLPRTIPSTTNRDRLIEESHRRYCRSREEVEQATLPAVHHRPVSHAGTTTRGPVDVEEFRYDEFK